MPVEVHQRWSDRGLTPGEDGSTTYEVFGAANDREAAQAIPVKAGQRHPLDNRLVATAPRVISKSPNRNDTEGGLRYVTVRWVAEDSQEAQDQDPGGDPLAAPPRYRWRPELIGVEVDTDVEGNPILNSAREPPDPLPTAEIIQLHLTVMLNERFYDVNRALQFMNTTNSDIWRVPGTPYTVQPGRAHCRNIVPTGDVQKGQAYIEVSYDFEFRLDGFKLRLPDKGTKASLWGNIKNETASIMGSGRTERTEATQLNGKGVPLGSEYVAFPNGETFLPYGGPPEGAEIEETLYAVFLKYKTKRSVPFAGLRLS